MSDKQVRPQGSLDVHVYPVEVSQNPSHTLFLVLTLMKARERLSSYRGKLTMRISFSVNDGPEHVEVRDCGLLPIMVRVRIYRRQSEMLTNCFI
jgi:DNA-directed RNA polymerase beta subunit